MFTDHFLPVSERMLPRKPTKRENLTTTKNEATSQYEQVFSYKQSITCNEISWWQKSVY